MMRAVLVGDTRERLRNDVADESVDCIVTSPPYWALRDYGVAGQIGLEPTWREHLANLRGVFAECHRVLKPTGSLWVNYGDTVSGATVGARDAGSWKGKGRAPEGVQPANAPNRLSKEDPPKHKLGLAWRLRFMLNDDLGFISRADIVWHKPNAMPLSMRDRVTPKYEMFFHFVKRPRYWFDLDAIRKPFSEATTKCLSQATFDQQTGGPKDYGGTMSARGALENLKRRTDNTWEARRGASTSGKGPAAGQKPHSTQRRAKTLEADALRPAREATSGVPPERGEDGGPDENGHYGGVGANPGDVWEVPWTESDDEWDSALWTIPNQPFADAHFATFPEELARRAIVSSCPREVCTKCLLGTRQRETSPEMLGTYGRPREEGARYSAASESGSHKAPGAGMAGTGRVIRRVVGYKDCGCGAPFVPGVVLDPFAGAFTAPYVAAKEARGFIGIELNQAYVDIGLKRLAPYMRPLSSFGGAEA